MFPRRNSRIGYLFKGVFSVILFAVVLGLSTYADGSNTMHTFGAEVIVINYPDQQSKDDTSQPLCTIGQCHACPHALLAIGAALSVAPLWKLSMGWVNESLESLIPDVEVPPPRKMNGAVV